MVVTLFSQEITQMVPDDDHPDNKPPGDHQARRGPKRPQEIAIGKTMPSEP